MIFLLLDVVQVNAKIVFLDRTVTRLCAGYCNECYLVIIALHASP